MDMTFTYAIAERNIAVTSLHDEVHQLCADYLSPDASSDFAVETTQADIEFERQKTAREDEAKGIPVRQFTDRYSAFSAWTPDLGFARSSVVYRTG